MLRNQVIELAKRPTARSTVQFAPFHVADIDWSVNDESLTVSIDGDEYEVDRDGFKYIVAYGLRQALTDSYSAETTRAKARKAVEARLEKIVNGEMALDGSRGSDPVKTEMRKLAIALIVQERGKSESALRKSFEKGAKPGFNGLVRDMLDRFESKIRAVAVANVNSRKLSVADILAVDEEGDESEGEQQSEEQTPAPQVEAPTPEATPKSKRSKKAA
jgi:hypothetical protein